MATVLNSLFAWILPTTLYTSVVVLLILPAQCALGRRLGARWRYALWALVIARALAPALPQSAWSVFNYAPNVTPAAADLSTLPLPTVKIHIEPATPGQSVQLTHAIAEPPARLNAFAVVWLGGCAVLSLLTFISATRFARRLRRASVITCPRIARILDECRQLVGVRRAPPIVCMPGVLGPALTGLFRPRIVVPPGQFENLDDDELRCVLTHELAHLRRRDLACEWLLVIVRAVHWFNPLVWYAVARCRADRELACDEQVMRLTSSASVRHSYGHTILKLAQQMPRAIPLPGVVGILEGRSQLKKRIQMIARFNGTGSRFAAAMFLLVTLVLASCTLTNRKSHTPASAAASPPGKVDEHGRTMRVYDVRDLIIDIPDFNSALKFNSSTRPTTLPGTAPEQRTREEMTDELITLIKDVVAPETWGQPAGSAVRVLQGQLIVTATPAIQEQVRNLLEQLRETRALQITVETRFISVTDAGLAKMKREMAELFTGETATTAPGEPSAGAKTFLNRDQVQAFLRAIAASKEAAIVTAPRVTLFNGQRAYVLVGTQRAYVKSLTINKSADGKTSYEPEIGIADSGVILDAQATITSDRKRATITLRPQLAELKAIRDVPFPNSPPGENLSVQQPDVETSEIRTTVTVGDGETVLIRGLRGSMNLEQDPSGKPSQARNVLLLVKPTIIVEGKIAN
jgi:beta-lactamase regulating signal transducer with metallopeptidase domain